MIEPEKIITQTKKWVVDVVIGCNFCPFAAREVKRGTIAYKVLEETIQKEIIKVFLQAVEELNNNAAIETTLVIIPSGMEKFSTYLKLVAQAEDALVENGFEGIFQVASFHPSYLFSGSNDSDAANFTNRSPYPMLHILREASLTQVIAQHPDTSAIPERNMDYTRTKGLAHMKLLFERSLLL